MTASCASLRSSLSACLGAHSSAPPIKQSSRPPAATSYSSFFTFMYSFKWSLKENLRNAFNRKIKGTPKFIFY